MPVPVLVQAAWTAVRNKECYYRALFLRLRSRRGPKKAIVAVAAAILASVFHILTDGTFYEDLGPNHFNRLVVIPVLGGLHHDYQRAS